MVKLGQVLFRLSNTQRQLELLQRKSEHTQQISNLANLQVGFQVSASDQQRRLSALAFELEQHQKRYLRDQKLAMQGFISKVALEESADLYERKRYTYQEQQQVAKQEGQVRAAARKKMTSGINGLQRGLELVNASVDALAVRAPSSGKLTDFLLQLGESVGAGKQLGSIDDVSQFKLQAQIGEFYLARIHPGITGRTTSANTELAVKGNRVAPQINRASPHQTWTQGSAEFILSFQFSDASL